MSNETLYRVADATTEKPIFLDVEITPKNRLHAWLMARGYRPKTRRLVLHDLKLGTLIRLSGLLTGIDVEGMDRTNLFRGNLLLAKTDGRTLARCVALALHNQKSEPPESLVDFILYHFTAPELQNTVELVIKKMNVASFMTTIILVHGMNILEKPKMSPRTGEIIAPGQPSAD